MYCVHAKKNFSITSELKYKMVNNNIVRAAVLRVSCCVCRAACVELRICLSAHSSIERAAAAAAFLIDLCSFMARCKLYISPSHAQVMLIVYVSEDLYDLGIFSMPKLHQEMHLLNTLYILLKIRFSCLNLQGVVKYFTTQYFFYILQRH